MMLGIPANSSMAVPIGRRKIGGHSSVRKMAMPMPIGTAIAIAMTDVTIVPKIGAPAPNFSVTGFQTTVVKKPKPKAPNAGIEPFISDTITPPRVRSTTIAAPCVNRRKKLSPDAKRFVAFPRI